MRHFFGGIVCWLAAWHPVTWRVMEVTFGDGDRSAIHSGSCPRCGRYYQIVSNYGKRR